MQFGAFLIIGCVLVAADVQEQLESAAAQSSQQGDSTAGTDSDGTDGAAMQRGLLGLGQRMPVKGPLSTDRPGFADTTAVMPQGHLQLELGYTYTNDDENGDERRDHTIGQANLRFGLLENLELRTLWSGYSMTETEFDSTSRWAGRHTRETDHDDGAGDMALGLRTQILRNDGLVPDLSLLTDLSIPVGSDSKSAGDVVPDFRMAYGWALTKKLRVYGVGVAAGAVDAEGTYFQGAASAALSYALSDRFGSFVEYYGIYPSGRDSDSAHHADGGITILVNDNVQVDFSAGVGLNEQAPDYFVGFGVSLRF